MGKYLNRLKNAQTLLEKEDFEEISKTDSKTHKHFWKRKILGKYPNKIKNAQTLLEKEDFEEIP